MEKYIVTSTRKGGRALVYRFNDFKSACAQYKAILNAYRDSDWLESVYKDTKIEKWNPTTEKYETI